MTVATKKKEVLMSNKLGEKMENKLAAQEADSEIDNFEEEVAINEKIAEVLEKRQKDKFPALPKMQQRQSCQRKLLRLIKTCVSLKDTALQRLMNYFMQMLKRQKREKIQCGGGGYKIALMD